MVAGKIWDPGTEAFVDVTSSGAQFDVEVLDEIAEGGVRVVKFPFAYNTVGLATGVTVYTPAAGDVLLDAWVDITTKFVRTGGASLKADIGTFSGATTGLFYFVNTALTLQDNAVSDADGGGSGYLADVAPGAQAPLTTWELVYTPPPALPIRGVPGTFTDPAKPLKLVVNQTGAVGGTATPMTAGAATLYLAVATPTA